MHNKVTLEINGQSYLLTFGLKFLELLNAKYTINLEGLEVGAGVAQAWAELKIQNPVMIRDMILFATATNVNRPSESEVEAYIYSQLEDEESAAALIDTFFEYLKLAPGARRFINQAEGLQEPEAPKAPKKAKKTASK